VAACFSVGRFRTKTGEGCSRQGEALVQQFGGTGEGARGSGGRRASSTEGKNGIQEMTAVYLVTVPKSMHS